MGKGEAAMEKENGKLVMYGLREFSFKSYKELEEFFIKSWSDGRFEGMSTKAIGKKFYVWERKEQGGGAWRVT